MLDEKCNSCKKFKVCDEKVRRKRPIKCAYEPTEEALRLPDYSEEQMDKLLRTVMMLGLDCD